MRHQTANNEHFSHCLLLNDNIFFREKKNASRLAFDTPWSAAAAACCWVLSAVCWVKRNPLERPEK